MTAEQGGSEGKLLKTQVESERDKTVLAVPVTGPPSTAHLSSAELHTRLGGATYGAEWA